MLSEIDTCTHDIKMFLIKLGFELTPPTRLHNHKLKQTHHDIFEISTQFNHNPVDIFDGAQYVFFQCTGHWQDVRNLDELHTASTWTKQYLTRYF